MKHVLLTIIREWKAKAAELQEKADRLDRLSEPERACRLQTRSDELECCAWTLENRLAELAASRPSCPHCQLPAVLPDVCTPALNAVLDAQIAKDAALFDAGRQQGIAQGAGSRDWQAIETAPTCCKVLVTWINEHGKRRTAMASYWPAGSLAMGEDVPDYLVTEDGQNVDAGWWEESEGNDEAMFRLVENMTHWMPLPAPPKDADQ